MTPQELKNSILQLAIQGKLVEQRAEEGTAAELYQQIQEEKELLIAEGKIKKEKPLPEITAEEIPFDIPESWMWVRLGNYSEKVTDQVASGSFASLRENVPSLKEPDYAIMVKTADFSNGFTRNLTYTTQHGYEFLSNSNLFGGELILSNIGSIGKCFIVPELKHKMTLAPNAVMVRLTINALRDYLYYFILSYQGFQELSEITSGTAMKKFNKTDLKKILIPVPPLAEQKRIVAKIEELLPYIDRYEQAWSKLEAFNKRFPVDMQKSILQTAIQGKLVEQRPEEGTGEELYQQIQTEKQRLVKEGKIKKEKPLPEITEDEIPFDIPESWKWCSVGAVCTNVQYGTSSKSSVAGKVPVLRMGNIQNGKIDYEKLVYSSDDNEIEKYKLDYNDLLFNRTNSKELVGKTAIYKAEISAIYAGYLVRVTPVLLDSDYLNYVMQSKYYWQYCQSVRSDAIGQSNINAEKLKRFFFPLPPLAEQKRIVAKLEELLPLCERLK